MLVLTRQIGQQIRIADDILIQVLDVDSNRVYLGVTAPPQVRIDRHEVYLRRLQQEAESGGAAARCTG